MTNNSASRARCSILLAVALVALCAFSAAAQASSGQVISLEQALAFVEEHHPQVLTAQRQLERAEGNLTVARNAYMPNVSVTLTPTQRLNDDWNRTAELDAQGNLHLPTGLNINSKVILGTLSHASGDDWSLDGPSLASLNLTQRLFEDASLNDAPQAVIEAELGLAAAKQQLWNVTQQAKRDVYDRMFRLEAASLRYHWAQLAEKNAQRSLDEVEQRIAIGADGEISQLAAQIALQQAQLHVRRSARTLQNLSEDLGSLLGMEDAAPENFAPVTSLGGQAVLTEKEYLSAAEAISTNLWQAERRLEQAENRLKSEVRSYGPTVEARGRYSGSEWSVSLWITQSLTDVLNRTPEVRDREIAVLEAEEQYESAREQLAKTVAAAVANLQDREDEVDIARLAYSKARLELLQGKSLHQAGMLDDLSLERLEIALAQAELELRDKEHNHLMQVMELSILAGIDAL